MLIERTASRRLASALLAFALTACAGQDLREDPHTAVAALPDGTRIAFVHQQGRAQTPTVVFQSGLGDDHAVWAPVLEQLPSGVDAIAPDRPGYGESPAALDARSACRIAQEQRQLLRRSGAKPPYLLVGHSIGGLYQYVYARLYPEEVAGLVLLDPTHPELLETLRDAQPGAAALLQLARMTVFTPTMRQEFDAQGDCLGAVDQAAQLSTPTVVLASTRAPALAGPALQAALEHLRQDWLARTGGAALIRVDGSGHQIHRDAPQAVATAIAALLTSAASR